VPSQPPSPQPLSRRADGLVSIPTLPDSELQTAKASPVVESSIRHMEAIATKDMHDDSSEATESYENRDEQRAGSESVATNKEDETREQPKISFSTDLTEHTVEEHEVEERGSLSVDASTNKAMLRDQEGIAILKLDWGLLDVGETELAPGASEKRAEEQVGTTLPQYGTKSPEEEKRQDVGSPGPSSQDTLREKADIFEGIPCRRPSLEGGPPLYGTSDTTIASHINSKDLALSELSDANLSTDKIDGTKENEPDEQGHSDHLDTKLREGQANERPDAVRLHSQWGQDNPIQQPEKSLSQTDCRSRIDEDDECSNSALLNLQLINGTKANPPLMIPPDLPLTGKVNGHAAMASETM
jgi:hypothetical protein